MILVSKLLLKLEAYPYIKKVFITESNTLVISVLEGSLHFHTYSDIRRVCIVEESNTLVIFVTKISEALITLSDTKRLCMMARE